MLEMLSLYYTKIWLCSLASKSNERLRCKVQVRDISLIPFPETVSADKISVETCTEGPGRGNQALTPRIEFCREKPCVKKALAEAEEFITHAHVLSEFQQEVPEERVKHGYFRSIGEESWGTGRFVFKSYFGVKKRGSGPAETNISSCMWMEMFILFQDNWCIMPHS